MTSRPPVTHRVVLSYACYGICVSGGRVVYAAPIAKWAIGKTLAEFEDWVKRKGGTIGVLGDNHASL